MCKVKIHKPTLTNDLILLEFSYVQKICMIFRVNKRHLRTAVVTFVNKLYFPTTQTINAMTYHKTTKNLS